MSPKKYKLMTPGPVPVAEWVLKELAEPVLHHRTPEFSEILQRVFDNLKTIFCTKEPCLVLNSSGTGAMEAAMINTVKRGEDVLVIDSGKFGNRWYEMAQAHGYKCHHLVFEWGKPIDVSLVKKTLKTHPEIKAIFCQASETSTGSLLPVENLANLTKDTSTLLIVDGITAVGCMPIPMDEWGIDILISGSQKALMLPTGLSFIAASQKAWTAIETVAPQQSYYWNLVEERKACLKSQTHFSSSVSLIRALDAVLLSISKQGLQSLHETINQRAEHFRKVVLNEHVQMLSLIHI